MKILITGGRGFLGSNLAAQLEVREEFEVRSYRHDAGPGALRDAVAEADAICHLAGVNRPPDDSEFGRVNTGFTRMLCDTVRDTGRLVPILFTSSVHVERGNAYGLSKLAAEDLLLKYAEETGAAVHIFRLPHVIGKWCRPNYNSVVATFCHNIARDLPIEVTDPACQLKIVYIDDLVATFARIMLAGDASEPYHEVEPSYRISVAELAERLRGFRDGRDSLVAPQAGCGLTRALYATYLSYLPKDQFAYQVSEHTDARGTFVEMLKTSDSGQFSFFTAHPGVTRGGHFHHTKTEKFLVVRGRALFRFRHILSGERHDLRISGDVPTIVDTIPGWAHDITNVGDDELVVMLWANEVFDRGKPDTYIAPLT